MRFLTGGKIDPVVKIREKISLTSAIESWMRRDIEGSLAWLKERPEMVRAILRKAKKREGWSSSTERRYRRVLVECFTKEKREEILQEMLNDENSSLDQLKMFTSGWWGRKDTLADIKELQISEELSERILAKLRVGSNWDNQDE